MNLFGWVRHFLPELKHSSLSVFLAKPGKRKAKFYENKAIECWPKVFKRDAVNTFANVVSNEMERWGELLPNHDFIDESNYLSLLIENSHSLTVASDLPAMMASIEMRSPFLDKEIISAAMGIHFSKKVKGPKDGSQLKNILRKAVKDLVPREVMYAPKRGFGMGVQIKDILQNSWQRHADDIFNTFPDFGLFDVENIKLMWSSAKGSGAGQWDLLAKLFSIGLWSREVQ
jgi:asparagine synthase (glutamine-hydrolysing)